MTVNYEFCSFVVGKDFIYKDYKIVDFDGTNQYNFMSLVKM